MNPIYFTKQDVSGLIDIGGEAKERTITIEGEAFNENIVPISSTPIYSRIQLKEGDEVIGSPYFVHQKMTKEDLEAQVELWSKDIDRVIKALTAK
jgi:predicted HTH transcriptional regulator